MTPIELRVNYHAAAGERVCVAGNVYDGNWEPHQMEIAEGCDAQSGWWSAKLALPEKCLNEENGNATMEYKFVVLREGGNNRWEECGNRVVMVKMPKNKECSLCFTDCWAYPLESKLEVVGDDGSDCEKVVATFSEKKDDGVLIEDTVEKNAILVKKPSVPEPVPEKKVEAEPVPVAEEKKAEPVAEPEPEKKVEAEPVVAEKKPEPEPEPEKKPEPVVEPVVEKVEAKTEPAAEKAEPKVEAKPVEKKAEAKPEPVVEKKVEAKPEPVVEKKAEPKVEAKPVEKKAEPKANAKPAAKKAAAKPAAEKKPETKAAAAKGKKQYRQVQPDEEPKRETVTLKHVTPKEPEPDDEKAKLGVGHKRNLSHVEECKKVFEPEGTPVNIPQFLRTASSKNNSARRLAQYQ